MESINSSPGYTRSTTSCDAKKQISQIGSDCDGIISLTSSSTTCGSSSVTGPHTPNLSTNRTKKPTTFKNLKSFRRRPKSRIPVERDELQETNKPAFDLSKGKKPVSLGRNKPLPALSSLPSFRNVRILMKKASFKPKRSSSSYSKDVAVVTRPTHSSALKGSKIPEPVETDKGCRYHHCSLHGHCHGEHDPVSQTKRFVYDRRRMLRRQKSLVPKNKRGTDKRKDSWKSEMVSFAEQEDQDENIQELTEVAFGETAFPERSYRENLEISRKYSLYVQEFGVMNLGQHKHCPTCTCSMHENEIPRSGFAGVAQRPNEQVTYYTEDTVSSSRVNEKANNEDGAKATTQRSLNSEGEGDSKAESVLASDVMLSEAVQVNDSETNSHTQEFEQLQFSKTRHISMWNMIHEHMASNLAAPEGESERSVDAESSFPVKETENLDSEGENREIEVRKMFAVKLVREAIEKILLPEVQDQSSDDQSSVSSESTPRTDVLERNLIEASTEENRADEDEGNEPAQPKQESTEIKKLEIKKSGNKAPKHWSNLKKWILLQKFIRELEKVKKFNLKKPQLLPLNPDPEAEKVNLRPLAADGRKNSEEWMLDYALRQAVDQLAPTQKRKVALLVRAFETVAPVKEEESPQAQCRIPKVISDESIFPANQESGLEETEFQENITSSSVEGKTEESEGKDHIKMWHMIYQHVVSGIAEKVGSQLLDGSEDDEADDIKKSHVSSEFTKSDALKLVKEAVDEILLPKTQEDSPDAENGERSEAPKAKNWSKLKRLVLLKKTMRALEKSRRVEPQETEKKEMKRQMMDEKKKAEQWMLDYAVQHIVTKLTPDRKRRVSMLVEAFEAVVPLPEML